MTITRRAPDDAVAGAGEIALTLDRLMRLHVSHSFKDALKPAQWDALRYFANAPKSQRKITAFARHRATTLGTASTTVSVLVGKGLLLRDYGTGMPRNLGLRVSAAGLAQLAHDPMAHLTASIAALDPASRQSLYAALPKLVAGMAQVWHEETGA